VRPPEYVLQKSDSSRCYECDKYVYLLIEKYANPSGTFPIFFICFDCKRVSQAGVGRLEPIGTEDLEQG